MKALILDGKVVDLHQTGFEVASTMQWVDCDDTVEVGFTYADGVFAHWDTRTDAEKAANALGMLRKARDAKLAQTDYLALSDNTMSAEMETYRQALRDITETYTSLEDVVWPVKPE
jgi:hypothetical protein